MACGGSVGASAGGTVTDLLSKGTLDKYLTHKPDVSFWRLRYNKHTHFAMEPLYQQFQGRVGFGEEAMVPLNRTGDMIFHMYVVIDLPGIMGVKKADGTAGACGGRWGVSQFPSPNPCDPLCDGYDLSGLCGREQQYAAKNDEMLKNCRDNSCNETGDCDETYYAYYTNAIGQFLVKRATFIVGGQVVDTLYNDFLFMWEELAGRPGKRLTEMIGKRKSVDDLIMDSLRDRTLYVPLPFYFTQHSGNALPLVSLQFHGIQIHVCFETLQRSIIQSCRDVLVIKTKDCQPITNSDLDAYLDTTYVYLGKQERDRFAAAHFEQLITQVQQFSMSTNSKSVRMNIHFNHPTIELIWAIRRTANSDVNNHFCYEGKFGKDPMEYATLKLNNLPRFQGREARYFRLVQPYQFHSLIPNAMIYVFSFALHPESANPSGSINFSRIDNIELVLDLQDELKGEYVEIILFARNWNVMRFREGLGGIGYSA